jgi:hypothetical protein
VELPCASQDHASMPSLRATGTQNTASKYFDHIVLTILCASYGSSGHILLESRSRARQAHRTPARHGTTVRSPSVAAHQATHRTDLTRSNMATIQQYMQPVTKAAKNPQSLLSAVQSATAQPVNMLNQVRSMSSAQWMSVGIVAAEVVGFFTVGEMLGRLKLVGYRAKSEEHH